MKILITGANGLLGQKIVNQLINRGDIDYVATAKGENRNPNCPDSAYFSLDITEKTEIVEVCNKVQPTIIINTAAMTNVDACEDNKNACYTLNVDAVAHLFQYSKANGIHFQQISTDFVFDGEKGNYSEDDEVNPLSVYGKSKADSENILLNDEYKNWSVLRTIILLGIIPEMSRSNIVLWAKSALQKGDVLNIVNDQFRAPTWANDLAWACIEVAINHKNGIYHISGPETLSILEIVEKVGTHYNLDISNINPVSSTTLNQKAGRPPKTGFNISKAKREINYSPKTLKEILVALDLELKQ